MNQDKIELENFPSGGYQGKLLRVNLSKHVVSEESINPEMLHEYIGGTGLGLRLLYDEVKPGVDPYAADNRIVFATGPLTGTLIPGSGTYAMKKKLNWCDLRAGAGGERFR